MVAVTIRTSPAFEAAGVKTRINHVEDFHVFWAQCHRDGTIDRLRGMNDSPGSVTASQVFGVSRVEKDPECRLFDFYIAAEVQQKDRVPSGFDRFTIAPCIWAVFQGEGEMLDALYKAEMYAFGQWLPQSGYRHAPMPELEVYPAKAPGTVQFWLPVVKIL